MVFAWVRAIDLKRLAGGTTLEFSDKLVGGVQVSIPAKASCNLGNFNL